MFSTGKNFLVLHPPKNCGNTMHTVFNRFYDAEVKGFPTDNNTGKGQGFGWSDEMLNKHATIETTYRLFPQTKTMKKICVIRNPWDRMVDWYCFCAMKPKCEFDTTLFWKWLNRPTPRNPKFYYPMSHYIYYGNKYQVDYMIEFANFAEEFPAVYKTVTGETLKDLPYINRSKEPRPYADFYKNGDDIDWALVEKVRAHFAEDLLFKNYEFEDTGKK